jgi:hypothetical protein
LHVFVEIEMSRPPEPQFLVDYREWVKAGPPKCCHTCDWYEDDGKCAKYEMEPPAEFAATEDECHDWIEECPF